MNFGGIDEEEYSAFDGARVLILPVSYEGTVSYGTGTGAGAMAIVDASRNMELYEEETDSEVYKIGIHTLKEFLPRSTPEAMMESLYDYSKDLVKSGKFLCMLGGEHSVSAPIIKAHAEQYHDMSVLQIDAHADLREHFIGTEAGTAGEAHHLVGTRRRNSSAQFCTSVIWRGPLAIVFRARMRSPAAATS